MEEQAVDALTLEGSVVYDMTIWGLFMQADIVVKVVIVVLIFASFWTWAIIFDKALRLGRLGARARRKSAISTAETVSETQTKVTPIRITAAASLAVVADAAAKVSSVSCRAEMPWV